PHLRIFYFPHAGHYIQFEQAELPHRVMRAFLLDEHDAMPPDTVDADPRLGNKPTERHDGVDHVGDRRSDERQADSQEIPNERQSAFHVACAFAWARLLDRTPRYERAFQDQPRETAEKEDRAVCR